MTIARFIILCDIFYNKDDLLQCEYKLKLNECFELFSAIRCIVNSLLQRAE